MKLLLDTHAFLWLTLDDTRLSEIARDYISQFNNELYLSPASYWEIAIKISIGKYDLSEPLVDFIDREIRHNHLRILPIGLNHADTVSRLPFHHKDPFDRLLIAQSLVEDIPILGCDSVFCAYGIDLIW